MITIFVVILSLIPTIATSAIITVSSTNDEFNEDGDCSLREAIASANQDLAFDQCERGNGADVIEFEARPEPRLFRLFRGGIDNDTSNFGDLDITDDLTIMGRGEEMTTIQLEVDRNAIERIFDIAPNGQTIFVTLANLTLTAAGDIGGQNNRGYGIRNRSGATLRLEQVTIRDLQSDTLDDSVVYNEGSLTLDQSRLINNRGGDSGGVTNLGDLDILDSQILGNSGRIGGGVLNRNMLTVSATTIADNRAAGGEGGGIYNANIAIVRSSALVDNRANRGGAVYNMGVMVIENSTMSGNRGEGAGGIDNQRVLTIRHSTVTDNESNTDTGGVRSAGVMELSHTIVAGNISQTLPETDCSGPGIMSLGYNLVGASCPSIGMGDRVVSSATVPVTVIGPLQDNGGPTVTHAPLPGSLAIDTGGMNCPPPTVDQRGRPRPSDGNGDGLPACDIGAVEAPPLPTADQQLWVSGRANIGSAGLDRVAETGCEANEPGDLPPFAPIPEGATTVQFMATGEVSLSEVEQGLGPDGEVLGEITYTGPDGIGHLTTERRGFLAGIFAPDSPPMLPAPLSLTITGQEQVQVRLTSPPLQLYNLFYIGDGQTLIGRTLVVDIPPGATRLYLGVVDACDGTQPVGVLS